MVYLGEKELRYFLKTSEMGREERKDFVIKLEEDHVFVEKAVSPMFRTMVAGILLPWDRYPYYRKWSDIVEDDLDLLSSPEFSRNLILATRRKRWIYTLISIENFLKLKDKYDRDFPRWSNYFLAYGWKRKGRRPKYTWVECAKMGFFTVFFPYSTREVYLLFQLKSVRRIFKVRRPPSYGEIMHLSRVAHHILVQ